MDHGKGTPVVAPRQRLAFVDNIRWTVIIMVVLTHACVTYSGMGSWYYVEKGALTTVQTLVFIFYETFAQAFFMGILFFAAALFVPGAYDKRGFARFLLDRSIRLGVPTLLYMLVLDPLTTLIRANGTGHPFAPGSVPGLWLQYVASGSFIGSSGPLWFALALLVFSVVYALCRLVSDAVRGSRPAPERPLPPSRALSGGAVVLMVIMAAGTFLVRIVQPIGTSVLNMQLCYFTQYILLFCVGLWAGRNGFLLGLTQRAGSFWLRLSLAGGIPAWLLLVVGDGIVGGGSPDLFTGGLHWQSAGMAAWESFFCVSFCMGLLVLYREHVNRRTRVTAVLADTSFGIYVFHAPILLGVTMLMRSFLAIPLAKAAIAAAAAWSVTLLVAWLVRRIPAVGRLFA